LCVTADVLFVYSTCVTFFNHFMSTKYCRWMFLFNWIHKCVEDGVVRDDLTLGLHKSLVTKYGGT